MTDEIRTAMAMTIKDKLKVLETLEPGSKEHQLLAADIAKLYDVGTRELIEDAKFTETVNRLELEREFKEKEFDLKEKEMDFKEKEFELKQKEEDLKEAELKERKKDRWTRLLEGIAGIFLPLIVYVWAFCKGMKFEETGSFSTPWTRQMVDSVKPTKKR